MSRQSGRLSQRHANISARQHLDFLDLPAEIRNFIYDLTVAQNSKVPVKRTAFVDDVLTGNGLVKIAKRTAVANNCFAIQSPFALTSKQVWNELYCRLKEHARSPDATLTITATNLDFTGPIALYDLILSDYKSPEHERHERPLETMPRILIKLNITRDLAPFSRHTLARIAKWFDLINNAGSEKIDYEIGKLENLASSVREFIEDLEQVFEGHKEARKISNVVCTWYSKRRSASRGESCLIGFYERIHSAAQDYDEESEDDSDQVTTSDESDDEFEPDEADEKRRDPNMNIEDGEDEDGLSIDDLKDLDAELPGIEYERFSTSRSGGLLPRDYMPLN